MRTCKVELLDRDGRTVATEHAYANSNSALQTAALKVARQLKDDNRDHPLGPLSVKFGRTRKA